MATVGPIQQQQSKLPTNTTNNLDWTLEYLNRCMSLTGCSLPTVEKSSKRKLLSNLFRIFSFSISMIFPTWLVAHIFVNAKFVSSTYITEYSTTVVSWNFIIDSLNLAVYVIFGHGFLLFLTRPSTWLPIKNTFKLLEESLETVDIYPKCRRFTIQAIIYITSSIIFFETVLIWAMVTNNSSTVRKFLDGSCQIFKAVPATVLTLFCTLALILSIHLSSIRLRIIKHNSISCFPWNLIEFQRFQLNALKWHHLLVGKGIQHLNQSFGIFLAIEVCFIFVGVINSSVYLLMNFLSKDWLLGVFSSSNIIDHLIRLYVLTSFCDDITNENNMIHEALAELLHLRPSLRLEISTFTEQLMVIKSDFDAMGFFSVSKRLFPSLIGTSLTYFLVLLQFHSAEKQ